MSAFWIVPPSSFGDERSAGYPAEPPAIFDPEKPVLVRRGEVEYDAQGRCFRHDFVLEDGLRFRHLEIVCRREDDGWDIRLEAREPMTLRRLRFWGVVPFPSGTTMAVNGFQGWTSTHEKDLSESMPSLRKILRSLSRPYGDYAWVETGGLVAHRRTFFRLPDASEWFVEFESETYGYWHWRHDRRTLSAVADVRGRAVLPGETMRWRCVWQRSNFQSCRVRPLVGFTTWYNYYNRIDETLILRLVERWRGVPIDVFQIDDGWQRAVGDWRENDKFGGGMGRLARAIKDAGLRAGLWLAPFVCAPGSEAFARLKRRVVAGYNPMWGGRLRPFFYRCDPDDDELRRLFDRVIDDWGFDFLKLDFLYAAALGEAEKSRGERMNRAVERIAQAVSQRATILACGVPCHAVGPPFDFWRMGPDVGPTPDFTLGRFLRVRERISTLNALRNAIVRTKLALDGRVGNDPDVFILREYGHRLPDELRFSNFLVNVVCGDLVFCSDDPGRYGLDTLRLYRMHIPHRPLDNYNYRIVGDEVYALNFAKHGMRYAAWVNLSRRTVRIRPGEEIVPWRADEYRRYFPAPHPLADGYDGAGRFKSYPTPLHPGTTLVLPAFATRIFVVFDVRRRSLAGGDGHVLPGCEIEPDGRMHAHATTDGKRLIY
ncbi:MAG: alpha-galactosidase, partial [Bacteroidia bacterium]|nr:alpha-galactosidase [Bacteroidia bacterium]